MKFGHDIEMIFLIFHYNSSCVYYQLIWQNDEVGIQYSPDISVKESFSIELHIYFSFTWTTTAAVLRFAQAHRISTHIF